MDAGKFSVGGSRGDVVFRRVGLEIVDHDVHSGRKGGVFEMEKRGIVFFFF